jgi:hypothetical protein
MQATSDQSSMTTRRTSVKPRYAKTASDDTQMRGGLCDGKEWVSRQDADGNTIKLSSFLPLMLPLVGHHYLTGEHSLGSNDD